MKIYENVYIGNFIFALGVRYGMNNDSMKLSDFVVSLFQQTPADPYISDLFAKLNGRSLIIEFKKDEIDDKEEKKLDTLCSKMNEKDSIIELISISQHCHYFGGGKLGNNFADIHFSPYLFIRDCEWHSMNDFINMLFDDSQNIGVDHRDFCKYLEFLKEIYDGERGSSTGSLIVNFDDDGKVTCVPISDISDLSLRLSDHDQKYNPPTLNTSSPRFGG